MLSTKNCGKKLSRAYIYHRALQVLLLHYEHSKLNSHFIFFFFRTHLIVYLYTIHYTYIWLGWFFFHLDFISFNLAITCVNKIKKKNKLKRNETKLSHSISFHIFIIPSLFVCISVWVGIFKYCCEMERGKKISKRFYIKMIVTVNWTD